LLLRFAAVVVTAVSGVTFVTGLRQEADEADLSGPAEYAKIRVRPKGGVGAAVRAWAAPETMHAQTQAIERGVQPRERLSAG
jgi:hypothetical protein